jgi:hypothetical protein
MSRIRCLVLAKSRQSAKRRKSVVGGGVAARSRRLCRALEPGFQGIFRVSANGFAGKPSKGYHSIVPAKPIAQREPIGVFSADSQAGDGSHIIELSHVVRFGRLAEVLARSRQAGVRQRTDASGDFQAVRVCVSLPRSEAGNDRAKAPRSSRSRTAAVSVE